MTRPELYQETYFDWEEEVTSEIASFMKTQMDKDYALGATPRDFHSKGHSWARATFTVDRLEDPEFRVGLFSEPRTYDAWVRFSNASNGKKPDSARDARGMAIKILGVPGDKLIEDGTDPSALDILMFTPSVFLTRNSKDFLGFIRASFGSKLKLFLFVLTHPRVGITVVRDFKRIASLLEQTYHSATPYRLGRMAVKYIAKSQLPAEASIPSEPADDFLLQNLQETLAEREVSFDFTVQPQTDPVWEKIEDGFSKWKSPAYKVATVRLPIQRVTTQELIDLSENAVYNPWRTLEEHRPLGNINRTRKVVYQTISEYRHARNSTRAIEPSPEELEDQGDYPPSLWSGSGGGGGGGRWWKPSAWQLVVALLLLLLLIPLLQQVYHFYRPSLPDPIRLDYAAATRLNEPSYDDWPDWWKEGYDGDYAGMTQGAGERLQWANEKDARNWWYHTPQGSLIMPYSWFMALNQFSSIPLMPENFRSFLDTDHVTQFRVIPSEEDPRYNPDGLPIGFVKSSIPDPVTGEHFIGITCSGCHTGQMSHEGKLYLVEGGAGQLDTITTLQRAIFSLLVTVSPVRPHRFRSFAKEVLGDNYNRDTRKALKKKVERFLARQVENQFIKPGLRNLVVTQASPGGFGRLDALNTGGNALYTPLDSSNNVPTNANVTIPPLWNAFRYDWVQLNASIRQPLARNVIEGVAVGAYVDLFREYGPVFGSTAEIENMWLLEEWHTYLEPPEWPEEFGPLDRNWVRRGKELYTEHCAACHAKICTEWVGCDPSDAGCPPFPFFPGQDKISEKYGFATYHLRTFNFFEIGTDPLDAMDFANRTVKGADKIKIDPPLARPGEEVSGAVVIAAAISGIIKQRFDELGLEQGYRDIWGGYRAELWNAPPEYPARPNAGIWSTAPFLHNNSVPNLWELLLPASERTPIFYTGSLEFDTENVGYANYTKADRIDNAFELDTSRPGNSNSGHEYGTELGEPERRAIIEYLKALRFEDEDWEDYFPDVSWQEKFKGAKWVEWVKPSDRCDKPVDSYASESGYYGEGEEPGEPYVAAEAAPAEPSPQ